MHSFTSDQLALNLRCRWQGLRVFRKMIERYVNEHVSLTFFDMSASDANPSLSCITCTRSMTRAFGLFDHLAYKRPSVGPIRQCASGLFLRACRSQTLVRSFSSSSCIWCFLYIIVSYTVSYCALKDARFFKVSCCFTHLIALKLKHVQSGKHFTLVNIRPLWKGVCPSKNA